MASTPAQIVQTSKNTEEKDPGTNFSVHPLLIAVNPEICLKGLRALFTYHVIGTFFMQERALIRG